MEDSVHAETLVRGQPSINLQEHSTSTEDPNGTELPSALRITENTSSSIADLAVCNRPKGHTPRQNSI